MTFLWGGKMSKLDEALKLLIEETDLEKEDLIELYKIFFDLFEKDKIAFYDNIQNNHYDKLKKLAHQLKGSSINLRMQTISDLAAELEQNALQGSQKCKFLFDEIVKEIEIFQSEY